GDRAGCGGAGPSGARRGMAGQQAQRAWRGARSGARGAGRLVHAGDFRAPGRHGTRRFRHTRGSGGTVRLVDINRNQFKQALQRRELQIGLWSTLCSNIAAEVVAHAGFDWILLDTEHSPNELPGLVTQLQAMGRSTTTPVVRAAWNDTVLIKRILDIGVQSVLLPYVQ